MENFKLITIDKISKYGQNYIEANTRIFENAEMTSRFVKTSEIKNVFPISDYDLEEHVDREVSWVKSMINDNLYKYFYLEVNKKYPCYRNTNESNLLLVKGDFRLFLEIMHTGGNFKA
jgi:hypothetical protein